MIENIVYSNSDYFDVLDIFNDSNAWPYIATAINKRRWNFSEYKIELEKIKNISNSQRHHNI